MFGLEQGLEGSSFPLTLAITYPDAVVMAGALANPTRYELGGLVPNFFVESMYKKLPHYLIEIVIFLLKSNLKY